MLTANDLTQGPARIKILLTRGIAPGLGLPEDSPPTLVIWAQPYTPPTPAEYAAGWPVVVFPEGRSTFTGRHKSLNYLFSLSARQYALDHGAKEASSWRPTAWFPRGPPPAWSIFTRGNFIPLKPPAPSPALPWRSCAGD